MRCSCAEGNASGPSGGSGAGEESRTLDLLLGKQTLCQLSYSREGVRIPQGALPRYSAPR